MAYHSTGNSGSGNVERIKPYRDDEKRNLGIEEENTYCYQAKGGSWVFIPKVINPYSVLHLEKSASITESKMAFRKHISTPNRQQRALVAYAAHMLSDGILYLKGEKTICDVFDYAINGDTASLARELLKYPAALECEDISGRTLLYIAARSGFYDTCEYLINKGARPIACGKDQSTPLHVASFYGHGVICLLLISHGASIMAANNYNNTPIDEAMNDETRQQITGTADNQITALIQSVNSSIVVPIENVTYKGKVIAMVLRQCHNKPPNGWSPAWHGTKFKYVESILKKGLQPAGSRIGEKMIQPPKGHYQLGTTHFGIKDWASAIFISPSVLYAGHSVYADRIVVDEKQWCVVICVVCRPGSFTAYQSTITKDDPVDGEPDIPEWRIDVEGDDLIWRQKEASNTIVTGVTFIDLSFFDDIGHERGLSYREATNLLHPNCS